MEYTVKKLSKLAGISTRTLRYYDEIDLLKPASINQSGYRVYGPKEVERLQLIMFYRELGVSLDEIRNILKEPSFDSYKALIKHREELIKKREQLDLLIANVENTIAFEEGRIKMTDREKFEGFKRKMIDENEKKYGDEIRKKYGNDEVNKSNERFGNLSREEYEEAVKLEVNMKEILSQAFEGGDPSSELAQKAAELHKRWLMFFWDSYSKEAHAGLANMYVEDKRFSAYYDANKLGTAKFLRDAILIYTGIE